MTSPDLVVRGHNVLLPGEMRAADVVVAGGRVAAVVPYRTALGGEVIEAGDRVVLPGLVDTHVHVNEPGRTHWEGFDTATRAAAAGGTTTIVDMPLNSVPPTVDRDALELKRKTAAGRCLVDVGFWGGLIPGSESHLDALAEAGVCGFKAFLVDSGVPEFPPVTEDLLRKVLPRLARLRLPLQVHAEAPELVATCAPGGGYPEYLASRPSAAEDRAVALLADLAEESGAHLHVLHLASGGAVEVVRRAHRLGAPLSAETCPHYLSFAAEDIADGATDFKCAPPIRERQHREALWQGLGDGTIALVVSDHSPAPFELKSIGSGDLAAAWGGISSLQLRLAATWTAARPRGFGPADLARWLAAEPARLAGLDDRKGSIEPGKDADLVVWDPDASFTVEAASLHHRHPLTPYQGMTLSGVVETTIRRGKIVYRDGSPTADTGGELLRRRARPYPGFPATLDVLKNPGFETGGGGR